MIVMLMGWFNQVGWFKQVAEEEETLVKMHENNLLHSKLQPPAFHSGSLYCLKIEVKANMTSEIFTVNGDIKQRNILVPS